MEVVNRRDQAPSDNDVYIGRPGAWGNPFLIGRDGNRKEIITKYRIYAGNTYSNIDLQELNGKTLVCWCKPLDCHGDVLVKLVKELYDER